MTSKAYDPATVATPPSTVVPGAKTPGDSAEPESSESPGGSVDPDARLKVYGGRPPVVPNSVTFTCCPIMTSGIVIDVVARSSSAGMVLAAGSRNLRVTGTTPSVTVTTSANGVVRPRGLGVA